MSFGITVPIAILTLAAAGWVAAPAGAALMADPKCEKPKVFWKAVFHGERVSYTLEAQPEYARAGKPLGLFRYRTGNIEYLTRIQGGCLKQLDVKVAPQFAIYLRKPFESKAKKCTRKSVLQHERIHWGIAKKYYKSLALRIANTASTLFTGMAAPDAVTVVTELGAHLRRDVLPDFAKRHGDAQNNFHDKISQRDYIRKNCELVKRKRY